MHFSLCVKKSNARIYHYRKLTYVQMIKYKWWSRTVIWGFWWSCCYSICTFCLTVLGASWKTLTITCSLLLHNSSASFWLAECTLVEMQRSGIYHVLLHLLWQMTADMFLLNCYSRRHIISNHTSCWTSLYLSFLATLWRFKRTKKMFESW